MTDDETKNRQEVKFVFGDEEIEAEIVWWGTGSEFDVRFHDRNTGYHNSNPLSSNGSWSYQNPEAQRNILSLINAVEQWDDWSDHLSWEDGAKDEFEFGWDGKSNTVYGLKALTKK